MNKLNSLDEFFSNYFGEQSIQEFMENLLSDSLHDRKVHNSIIEAFDLGIAETEKGNEGVLDILAKHSVYVTDDTKDAAAYLSKLKDRYLEEYSKNK